MIISNPQQLISEFKKSGEFDRLRRELLNQFKNRSDGSTVTFMSRVEEIVRQKFSSDTKFGMFGPDAMHAELMQEMERYPLVQRAVADLPALSDTTFKSNIRKSLTNIMKADGHITSDQEGAKSTDQDEADMEESDGASDVSGDESDVPAHGRKEKNQDNMVAQQDKINKPGSPGKTEALHNVQSTDVHANPDSNAGNVKEGSSPVPMDLS